MSWVDDDLVSLGACEEAVCFARQYNTAQAAWDACDRPDWLFWWIGQRDSSAPRSPERRPLARAACACARLAEPWMPTASREALDVVAIPRLISRGHIEALPRRAGAVDVHPGFRG